MGRPKKYSKEFRERAVRLGSVLYFCGAFFVVSAQARTHVMLANIAFFLSITFVSVSCSNSNINNKDNKQNEIPAETEHDTGSLTEDVVDSDSTATADISSTDINTDANNTAIEYFQSVGSCANEKTIEDCKNNKDCQMAWGIIIEESDCIGNRRLNVCHPRSACELASTCMVNNEGLMVIFSEGCEIPGWKRGTGDCNIDKKTCDTD